MNKYQSKSWSRILASASQTLLSTESLNDELDTESKQTKENNNNNNAKNSLSPTYQLVSKLRTLTKSSEVTYTSWIIK